MSMAAVLQGVQQHLSESLHWTIDKDIHICPPPGRPPARCGQQCITIYPTQWDYGPDELNQGLDAYYGVNVLLTCRTGHIPYDKLMATGYVNTIKGAEPILNDIIKAVHIHRYVLLPTINKYLTGSDLMTEPLRYHGVQGPNPVGPDWFSAEDTGGTDWGFTLEVILRNARRLQALADFLPAI